MESKNHNFSVTDFHLNGDIDIFGELYIPENPRAAILLLHGLCNNSSCWEYYAKKLAARGYLCCTYDARNHGRSKSDFSLNGMVDDVSAVIDKLGNEHGISNFAVVGNSMGATIAALASASEPRIGACVTISLPVAPVKDSFSSKNRVITSIRKRLEDRVMGERINRNYLKFPRELLDDIHDERSLIRKIRNVLDFLDKARREQQPYINTQSFDIYKIYQEFNVDLVEEGVHERINQPFCMFHGQSDWLAPFHRAIELYGLLTSPRECYIYAGNRFTSGNHFICWYKHEDISERMIEFFENYLVKLNRKD